MNWASLPPGSVVVVVGGQPLDFLGLIPLATHLPREFERGAFMNRSPTETTWFGEVPWDHLIWIGNRAFELGDGPPAFNAFLVGHEIEHVWMAHEDLRAAALEMLVQIAAAKARPWIPLVKFPHERRCDLAGLRFAAEIHGREILVSDLKRIRDRTGHLLRLMEGSLDRPHDNTYDALVRWAVEHGLASEMVVFWKTDKYSHMTQYLDPTVFEPEDVEQRGCPRFDVHLENLQVTVGVLGFEATMGVVLNVSRSGIKVSLNREIPESLVGRDCLVRFVDAGDRVSGEAKLGTLLRMDERGEYAIQFAKPLEELPVTSDEQGDDT